jgi:hypothetical protein
MRPDDPSPELGLSEVGQERGAYLVRRWLQSRDEMSEEWVDVLDGITLEGGYVSVVWVHNGTTHPILETGPGGVRIFTP